MKRQSYSIHRCNSALYGKAVLLRDRLHAGLLTLADTTPGIAEYDVYSVRFTYDSSSRQKESSFPFAVKFDDGRIELWASTWAKERNEDSPAERARRTHSHSLGADYRLFTPDALESNRTLLKNRQTMQAVLFRGYHVETSILESSICEQVHATSQSISALAKHNSVSELHVQLAVFRLLRRQHISGPLATQFINPSWEVSHA